MENFRANPGGFPSQQFLPNSSMANGPQHMNGVTPQQDPTRQHPGYYQQPKQPFPSKVSVVAWNSRQNRFSPNVKCFLSFISVHLNTQNVYCLNCDNETFCLKTGFVVWKNVVFWGSEECLFYTEAKDIILALVRCETWSVFIYDIMHAFQVCWLTFCYVSVSPRNSWSHLLKYFFIQFECNFLFECPFFFWKSQMSFPLIKFITYCYHFLRPGSNKLLIAH